MIFRKEKCPPGYFEDDDRAEERRIKTRRKVLVAIFSAAAGTLGIAWHYSHQPEIPKVPEEKLIPAAIAPEM